MNLRYDPARYELRVRDEPFNEWTVTLDLQEGLTCFRGRREPLQHFGISGAGSLTTVVQNWDGQWDELQAEGEGAVTELVMKRVSPAQDRVLWTGVLGKPQRRFNKEGTWLALTARGVLSTMTNRKVSIPMQRDVTSLEAWAYLCQKIGVTGRALSQAGGADVPTFPYYWEKEASQFDAAQRIGLSTGGGWVYEARDSLALVLEHRNTRLLDKPVTLYGFPSLIPQALGEYSTQEAPQRTPLGTDEQTFSLGPMPYPPPDPDAPPPDPNPAIEGPVIWGEKNVSHPHRVGPWRGVFFHDGDPGYLTYLHLGSGQVQSGDELGKVEMHWDNEQVTEKNLTRAMVKGGSFVLTSGDDVLTIPGSVLEADPVEPYTFTIPAGEVRDALVAWCTALRAKSERDQAGVTLTLKRPIKLTVASAPEQGLKTPVVEIAGQPERVLWAVNENDGGYPLTLAAGASKTIKVPYPTEEQADDVVGVTMLEAMRHGPRTFTGYQCTTATGVPAAGTIRWIESSKTMLIGLLSADQTPLGERLALNNTIKLTDGTVVLTGRLDLAETVTPAVMRVSYQDEAQLTGTEETLATYIASNATGWSLESEDPADYTLAGSGELDLSAVVTNDGFEVRLRNPEAAAVVVERLQVRGHDAKPVGKDPVTTPPGAANPDETPEVFLRESDIRVWQSFLTTLQARPLVQLELRWHGDDDPQVLVDLDLSTRIPVVYESVSGNFFVEGIEYRIGQGDWIDVKLWLTLDVGYEYGSTIDPSLVGGGGRRWDYWDAIWGRTQQRPGHWPIFGGDVV